MCRQCSRDAKDYKTLYREFWKSLVEDENGELDRDKVMRELHDYSHMMDQVPSIYSHITGGRMSKPLYWAHDVIEQADEEQDRQSERFAAEVLHHMLADAEDTPEEPIIKGAVQAAVKVFHLSEALEGEIASAARIAEYLAKHEAAAAYANDEDPED